MAVLGPIERARHSISGILRAGRGFESGGLEFGQCTGTGFDEADRTLLLGRDGGASVARKYQGLR